MWWLLATFAVAGAVAAIQPDTDPLSNLAIIAHMIAVSFLAFGWVKAHSRQSGRNPPEGAALLAAAIPLLGVPVYLLRSLGAKTGSVATLKAVGFYLVCGLAYVVMFFLGSVAFTPG